MNDQTECRYAEGFTLWEKVYAQVTFNAMAIVGIIGIVSVDWLWATPYAFLYVFCVPFVIMRHLTCPRCPHLKTHGDCLQLTPKITKRLIKGEKDTLFSPIEKVLYYAIFILLPLYPLYWLLKNPDLLVIFLVSAGVWYGGQFLYFCKHCQVGACPFNQTPLRHQAR